jgi:hypothetical protein
MAIEGGDDFLSRLNSAFDDALKKVGTSLSANFDPKEIAKTVLDLDDAAVNVAKSFGQGRENIMAIKQGMADAVLSVTRLGGGLADIEKIQMSTAKELGRNLILSSESYEKLYATSQVINKDASLVVGKFKDAGFSAYQAGGEMEKVVNQARAIGVSAEAVSGKVLENMEYLNKFNFQGGVEGMARMAAQATSLRIDMKTALGFADKVFDPEGAIEMAAAMQRLGVANTQLLDPLRLMDMAQNDPAELQNQLVKMTEQFVQLNDKGQFEIMPGAKRQLMEISKQTGLAYSELTKMAIGSKELDSKLSQIKFPDTFTEDQKTMIANMAEMGKDGQFKITVDGSEMNLGEAMAKAQNNPDFFKSLEEASKPKSMEDLAKDQLTILGKINANLASLKIVPTAIARGKTATQAIELPAQLTELLSQTLNTPALSTKNIGEGFDKGAQDVLSGLNSLIKGEGSMTEVLTKLTENGEKLNKFAEEAFVQSADKYKQSLDKLGLANNQFYTVIEAAFKGLSGGAKDWVMGKDYNADNPKPVVVPQAPNSNVDKAKEVTTSPPPPPPTETAMSNQTKVSGEITININAPANIDTAQLVGTFQDAKVQEALMAAVSPSNANNGLTSSNPNRTQAFRTTQEMSGNLG